MSVNFFKNGALTKIARGLKDATVTITNNLLATKSGTALDAVQGKVLDDKITEVNNSLIPVLLADFTAVNQTQVVENLNDYKFILVLGGISGQTLASTCVPYDVFTEFQDTYAVYTFKSNTYYADIKIIDGNTLKVNQLQLFTWCKVYGV